MEQFDYSIYREESNSLNTNRNPERPKDNEKLADIEEVMGCGGNCGTCGKCMGKIQSAVAALQDPNMTPEQRNAAVAEAISSLRDPQKATALAEQLGAEGMKKLEQALVSQKIDTSDALLKDVINTINLQQKLFAEAINNASNGTASHSTVQNPVVNNNIFNQTPEAAVSRTPSIEATSERNIFERQRDSRESDNRTQKSEEPRENTTTSYSARSEWSSMTQSENGINASQPTTTAFTSTSSPNASAADANVTNSQRLEVVVNQTTSGTTADIQTRQIQVNATEMTDRKEQATAVSDASINNLYKAAAGNELPSEQANKSVVDALMAKLARAEESGIAEKMVKQEASVLNASEAKTGSEIKGTVSADLQQKPEKAFANAGEERAEEQKKTVRSELDLAKQQNERQERDVEKEKQTVQAKNEIAREISQFEKSEAKKEVAVHHLQPKSFEERITQQQNPQAPAETVRQNSINTAIADAARQQNQDAATANHAANEAANIARQQMISNLLAQQAAQAQQLSRIAQSTQAVREGTRIRQVRVSAGPEVESNRQRMNQQQLDAMRNVRAQIPITAVQERALQNANQALQTAMRLSIQNDQMVKLLQNLQVQRNNEVKNTPQQDALIARDLMKRFTEMHREFKQTVQSLEVLEQFKKGLDQRLQEINRDLEKGNLSRDKSQQLIINRDLLMRELNRITEALQSMQSLRDQLMEMIDALSMAQLIEELEMLSQSAGVDVTSKIKSLSSKVAKNGGSLRLYFEALEKSVRKQAANGAGVQVAQASSKSAGKGAPQRQKAATGTKGPSTSLEIYQKKVSDEKPKDDEENAVYAYAGHV